MMSKATQLINIWIYKSFNGANKPGNYHYVIPVDPQLIQTNKLILVSLTTLVEWIDKLSIKVIPNAQGITPDIEIINPLSSQTMWLYCRSLDSKHHKKAKLRCDYLITVGTDKNADVYIENSLLDGISIGKSLKWHVYSDDDLLSISSQQGYSEGAVTYKNANQAISNLTELIKSA